MDPIEQLIKTLTEDETKLRPAPHPFLQSLMWIVAAAAYLAIALVFFGVRPDIMQAIENPWFMVELVTLFGIFIATSVSTSLLAFPDLHQKRFITFAPILMFVLFLLVIFFAWSADNPLASLPAHTYECTYCIIMVSLLPAIWAFSHCANLLAYTTA